MRSFVDGFHSGEWSETVDVIDGVAGPADDEEGKEDVAETAELLILCSSSITLDGG